MGCRAFDPLQLGAIIWPFYVVWAEPMFYARADGT